MDELRDVTRRVVHLLSSRDYHALEALSHGERLSASEMAAAVAEYGRTLVDPPPNAFDLLEAIPIATAQPPAWAITMPLWTEEEGRSDLTLEMTVIKENGGMRVEIDDLHVL
jgi:hypothetical protein